MTFQTSDLAKLALFMYLSRMLSRKQRVIKDFKKGFSDHHPGGHDLPAHCTGKPVNRRVDRGVPV